MKRRTTIPMPRIEGDWLPLTGLRGMDLYEAVARSMLALGDPDHWDLLPSLGLVYNDDREQVCMVVELPIPAHIWAEAEHPINVVRWLTNTIDGDPTHPDFDKDGSLAAVWLVVEAWMSERPTDMDAEDAPRPSEDPNRVEQRLCLVVGPDANGYASLARGSTEVVMNDGADGRMIRALHKLLEAMTR